MSSTEKAPSASLDVGVAISAPFKDPEWFKKTILMGLMLFVPVAGALNLSGWMRAIAERRMHGGEEANILPEANLSYIGGGWRLFLAYLPLIGLLMLVLMVGGAGAGVIAVTAKHGRGEDIAVVIVLLMYAGVILGAFAMSIVGPAITFLHVVEGEAWSSVQFKRIWELMKLGGTQYLLFWVAIFVAGLIGQLGALACYVGLFVTIPLSAAINGASVAEFARVVKPVSPSYPIDGGTGTASGAPFPVKS